MFLILYAHCNFFKFLSFFLMMITADLVESNGGSLEFITESSVC